MDGPGHGSESQSIALWAACSTGNEYEVERLLDSMADVDSADPAATGGATVLVRPSHIGLFYGRTPPPPQYTPMKNTQYTQHTHTQHNSSTSGVTHVARRGHT